VTDDRHTGADLTAVARIQSVVGLRGDLRVQLLCSGPDRLGRLREVFVGMGTDTATRYQFQSVRVQQNGILVRLSGVEDRTAAEKLRGHFIFVTDADAEPPAAGSVRIDDFVGYEVVDEAGKLRGTIREVYTLPANDMWGVWTGTREVLIPAVAAWVSRVDSAKRRVELTRSEGLFEE
jgi:16S rRNA processing protein RimM